VGLKYCRWKKGRITDLKVGLQSSNEEKYPWKYFQRIRSVWHRGGIAPGEGRPRRWEEGWRKVVQCPRRDGNGEKDEGGDNESDGGRQGAGAVWQRCPVPGGGAKMFGMVEITPAKNIRNSSPLCLKH